MSLPIDVLTHLVRDQAATLDDDMNHAFEIKVNEYIWAAGGGLKTTTESAPEAFALAAEFVDLLTAEAGKEPGAETRVGATRNNDAESPVWRPTFWVVYRFA